jgi:hypothetical protein
MRRKRMVAWLLFLLVSSLVIACNSDEVGLEEKPDPVQEAEIATPTEAPAAATATTEPTPTATTPTEAAPPKDPLGWVVIEPGAPVGRRCVRPCMPRPTLPGSPVV